MPRADSLAALRSPTPRTRPSRSFQSLNSPFLRSSMMLAESAGPTPPIASRSAWLAVLASTAASADAATSVASAARTFFKMRRPERRIGSARSTQRRRVAADALGDVGERVVAADAAQPAQVRFGEALVLADQRRGKVDVVDLAGGHHLGQRLRRLAAFGARGIDDRHGDVVERLRMAAAEVEDAG